MFVRKATITSCGFLPSDFTCLSLLTEQPGPVAFLLLKVALAQDRPCGRRCYEDGVGRLVAQEHLLQSSVEVPLGVEHILVPHLPWDLRYFWVLEGLGFVN